MNLLVTTSLLLFSTSAFGAYSNNTRCVSPLDHPFEVAEKFEIESLETREIGILGYLAGSHQDMMFTAQMGMTNTQPVKNGCSKTSSLVLFMEPAEYSERPCSKFGSLLYRGAHIKTKGEVSPQAAMKAATKWVTKTVSANYPECPKSCSFASTTKLTTLGNELYVVSAMKCVSQRKSKVNLVHTALLHEWSCQN